MEKCNCEWHNFVKKQYEEKSEEPLSLHAVLAEARAVLENIIENKHRIFYSDSMDQDTSLEEDIRNLYKKVSERFS